MAATTHHFVGDLGVKVGASWSQTIACESAEDVPRNLAGWTARMRIRPTLTGDPLVELTEGDGLTIADADGEISLSISADDTADFEPEITEPDPARTAVRPAALWVYDFDLIRESDGFVEDYLEGMIAVRPRVPGA